ncbi:MAG TPA: hypothetical protein VL966_12950 [Alphaproteobacteria bacterium]|nr:hypothetical protein [Alphaproteobacteria bacterium]
MRNARAAALKLGLPVREAALLARLDTPEQIQALLTRMPTNFEPNGDTCRSVQATLRHGRAHCIEAAFVAACALWIHGHKPLLMDLRAKGDDDHVVVLFRRHGCWGAISKSNHIWLRWRDPVYRSLRELAMSYFHEYVAGAKKTLRAYSRPVDLSRFDPKLWVTNGDDCWEVGAACDDARHYSLVTRAQAATLTPRDVVEVRAGKMLQFRARDRKASLRY